MTIKEKQLTTVGYETKIKTKVMDVSKSLKVLCEIVEWVCPVYFHLKSLTKSILHNNLLKSVDFWIPIDIYKLVQILIEYYGNWLPWINYFDYLDWIPWDLFIFHKSLDWIPQKKFIVKKSFKIHWNLNSIHPPNLVITLKVLKSMYHNIDFDWQFNFFQAYGNMATLHCVHHLQISLEKL